MRGKAVLFALFLFMVSSMAVAAPRERLCDTEIPFDINLDATIARVSPLRFTAIFPASSAEFWFENSSSKQITSVLAVVELSDQKGQPTFDMLLHAFQFRGYRWSVSPASPDRQAQATIQFDVPLKTNEKRYWWMSSPSFVEKCPSTARAIFIEIQFDDGSTARHIDANARRNPVIVDASTMDLRNAPFSTPLNVLAKLNIDQRGKPSVADVGSAPTDIKRWLDTQMKRWEFTPAYTGETPVSGTLLILFRFHGDISDEQTLLTNLPDSGAVEIADVLPPKPDTPLSRVYIGSSTTSIRGIPTR